MVDVHEPVHKDCSHFVVYLTLARKIVAEDLVFGSTVAIDFLHIWANILWVGGHHNDRVLWYFLLVIIVRLRFSDIGDVLAEQPTLD